MVSCVFNGRLGNQMFQIAAAYSLALDNNDIAAFSILGLPHQNTMFKRLTPTHIFQPTTIYQELSFDYNPIPYQPNLIIRGFFQSEKYFIHNRNAILNIFYPSIEDIEKIRQKYRFILAEKTCSLHVRRGDYLNLSNNHPPCNIDYYQEAIGMLPKNTQFLIFSDDISWCRENFIGTRFHFIEGNDDNIDLYLMLLCENNIIANSSFSWWGAWLNQNPNKIVVAPNKWFGPGLQQHNTKDLIPETWKII